MFRMKKLEWGATTCPGGAVAYVTRCSVLGLCGCQVPEVWVQLQAPAPAVYQYMQVN